MSHVCFRILTLTALLMGSVAHGAYGQQAPEHERQAKGPTWQEVAEELMIDEAADEEEGSTRWEEHYELLEQLATAPLDLNHATREELEQLPFLSAQQVMDLMEYRDRYGAMRSLGELRMVPSLDYRELQLLPYFIYIGDEDAPETYFPRIDTIARNGHHTLTASGHVPFYTRKGDRNGYLGYRYRHTLRYEFSYGQWVKIGLTGAQDAGEPFFSNKNRWGYDAYNYYLQLKRLGPVEQVVVGKYKLSTGLGLVMNSSFSLGKSTTLQSLGRQQQTLRGHSSRSEADYLQGAAATLRLGRPLRLTAFASWRSIDATLNNDSTAATLITSGYHRTPTEMGKKYNTLMGALGSSLQWQDNGWHAGLTALYTHLDRSLEPNRNTLYRRHYAHGQHFVNASANYGYTGHGLSFNGETATDGKGHLATINALSYQLRSGLSVVALQRFYSYRYSSLHAHSFSDGGRVQNESGIYAGATWRPLARLQLQGYVDYAYFPWARYLVSQSSESWDAMLQATYTLHRWTLTARHRSHLRQRDNKKKTALTPNNNHRTRLQATWTDGHAWTLKTQADATRAFYLKPSTGWMLSQHATYDQGRVRLQAGAAWFHTDDYQSRVYTYEPRLQHEFSFSSYYGKGVRLLLMARTELGRHLRLTARLGYTNYFDRSTIGTGLQEVGHSTVTDLDVQLRYRF